jgi:hypothetical protein
MTSELQLRDLQAKNKSLEQALVALRADYDTLQIECDAECEKRMELSLQVTKLERQLAVEGLANADYAAERLDLLEHIDALTAELAAVKQERDTARTTASAASAAAAPAAAATDDDDDDDDDDSDDDDDDNSDDDDDEQVVHDRGDDEPTVPSAVARDPMDPASAANRLAAVNELIDSERRYVAFLSKMLTSFREPMAQLRDANSNALVVPAEAMKKIFINTDVIVGVSRSMLHELEERQKAFDNETTLVADVFLAIQPFLKASYSEYANKVDLSFELLEQHKASERFLDWLGATERMVGTSLRDLMINPVQRLPRYVMLLEQVCKFTPADHPDCAPLQRAAALMRETTQSVNERRAEYESLSRVRALGARLQGFDVFGQAAGVLHCKDGVLLQEARGEVHVVLLSNVLLTARHASAMSNLKSVMSRGSGSSRDKSASGSPLRVKDVVQLYKSQTTHAVVGDPLAFTVDISESSLTRPLKFTADSTAERDAWVAAIRAAVSKLE